MLTNGTVNILSQDMLDTLSNEELQTISETSGEGKAKKSPSTKLPHSVNWEKLSQRSRDTIKQIVLPHWYGYSYDEIAQRMGVTASLVSQRVKSLREEILKQNESS